VACLAEATSRDYHTLLTPAGVLYRDGVVRIADGAPRNALALGAGATATAILAVAPAATATGAESGSGSGSGSGRGRGRGRGSGASGGSGRGAPAARGRGRGRGSGSGSSGTGAGTGSDADAKHTALIHSQSQLRHSLTLLLTRAEHALHTLVAVAVANGRNMATQLATVTATATLRPLVACPALRPMVEWAVAVAVGVVGGSGCVARGLVVARGPAVPRACAPATTTATATATATATGGGSDGEDEDGDGDDDDDDDDQAQG
jgi:hypothetical protein